MSVALYRRYRQALKARPTSGRYMPYGWMLQRPESFLQWMAYESMLSEFAQELANSINEFTNLVDSLTVWAEVIAPLSETQRHSAVLEFINAPATLAVTLPHVIKSRFIFAAAHLCHQANQARQGDAWTDDFPLDEDIYFQAADRHGAGWRRYPAFNQRVQALAGAAYRRDTLNFRNTFNHRFSPRFVIGYTHLVTRRVDPDTGKVSCGFGNQAPLDLGRIAGLLALERDRAYAAFEAFQVLVREQEAAITVLVDERIASRPTRPA